MNPYEEELQKNIEAGQKPTGDDPDMQAYHEVFRRLNREPDFQLSPAFSDKVVSRLLEEKSNPYRDFVWLGVGIFFLIASCMTAMWMSGIKLNLNFRFTDLVFLKNISGYAGLFAFGVIFVIVLNQLDKKILSPKRDMHSQMK